MAHAVSRRPDRNSMYQLIAVHVEVLLHPRDECAVDVALIQVSEEGAMSETHDNLREEDVLDEVPQTGED